MYLNFYQLNKKPFSLAPDPEFLYLSQQHKDALGAIIYGIKERQGFVSVIGEVGTGKTTIVRSYLHKTARDKVLPIFIFNSSISFTELMKTFLREIGINSSIVQKMQNLSDMVNLAHKAMLEKARAGQTIVLIIDEAQNMPVETLAKLCILSNFETAKTKLVQIVLVGQPELHKKLSSYKLRQLRQRIAYRALITPLSTKDSVNYLNHRLSLASKGNKEIFTQGAIKKIVKHAKGIPRIINILGENCLVAGYGLQKKRITSVIVKQVITEYQGASSLVRLRFANVAIGLLFVVLAGGLFAFSFPQLESHKSLTSWLKGQIEEQQETFFPTTDTGIAPAVPTSGALKQIASELATRNNDIQVAEAETGSKTETGVVPVVLTGGALNQAADQASTHVTGNRVRESKSNDLLDLSSLLQTWESFTLIQTPGEHLEPKKSKLEALRSLLSAPLTVQAEKFSAHLKIVKKGDTVSSLCLSTYGFVNNQILGWVKHHNPHIYNLDEIHVNEIILLPSIEQPNVLQIPSHKANHSSHTKEEIVSR